jgi:hypothetical protein
MTTQRTTQDFLLDYLTLLHNSHPTPYKGYVYASQADLLLQYGKWFASTGNKPGLKMGAMQLCFFNARNTAVRYPQDYTYYEGYAMSRNTGLPHPHAWVVDHTGLAWDVTWPIPEVRQATAMIGIRVPHGVLRAHWRTCGGASLLQDYYHDYPCMQIKYTRWLPELVPMLEALREAHCLPEVAAGRMILLPDGSMASPNSLGE